jgi:hypothetical protein
MIPTSNLASKGMFMPQFMPMYQPQLTDGISSAVSQISGGMGDEYTNRLLGALGMGDVSQYQMQQPMLPPMQFYSPYMNPYAGMFSSYIQQPTMYDPLRQSQLTGGTPNDPSTGNPMFTNEEFANFVVNFLPGVGLVRGVGDVLGGLFGGDTTPSTTDDAYSSRGGGSMSSSQAASAAAADTSYGPSF